jgi:hypothetical protein
MHVRVGEIGVGKIAAGGTHSKEEADYTAAEVLTELAGVLRLSSGRPRRAKFFANRSGRVADPFDCARQFVFSNAKMPRPIFNVILMLDDDFAAVRTDCFTGHFCGSGSL